MTASFSTVSWEQYQVLLLHKLPMHLWETLVTSGSSGKGWQHVLFPGWKPHSGALFMQSIKRDKSTDSFQINDSLNYRHWSGPENRNYGEIKGGAVWSITGNLNTLSLVKRLQTFQWAPFPQSQIFAKAIKVSPHWHLLRSWWDACAPLGSGGTGEEKTGGKG